MINQMTTMRLPDGAEVAFVDWQDQPLFSTVDLLANFTDTELDAFTYVVGDRVPASANATVSRLATERDTNVSTPGSMASTEEMLVYAIKPEVLELRTAPGTPTDLTSVSSVGANLPTPQIQRLANLHHALLLRLIVSQKVEQGAPLGYFNAGFGPYGTWQTVPGAAGATPTTGATQGLPSQEAVRSFVIPIHIGGQEKYRVSLVNATGAAVPSGFTTDAGGVDDPLTVHQVRIMLDGLYKRPVT